MAITHIQLFSVPVTDHDRARTFYVDRLGFDFISDRPMGPDGRWVQVTPKGAQTSITLVTDIETMPPGSVKGIVLESDDLVPDVAASANVGSRSKAMSRSPRGVAGSCSTTPTATGSSSRPRRRWARVPEFFRHLP
jgi:catechol 2,3-dioxygenase-like lactoylglutathione lyase family enzyme